MNQEKNDMKTMLINALMRKFKGHCCKCWKEDEHSALNCPVLEKSICDECSGLHHTNACGLIGKKRKFIVNKKGR